MPWTFFTAAGEAKNLVSGIDGTDISPNQVTINTELILAGQLTSTSTGTITDLDTTGKGRLLWNGASAASLAGIVAQTAGDILVVDNVTTAQTLTLLDNDTGSEGTAVNRIRCPNGANLIIPPLGGVVLIYQSSRWRVLAPFNVSATAASAVGTASAGSSADVSRQDHVHAITSTQDTLAANSTGIAGTYTTIVSHSLAAGTYLVTAFCTVTANGGANTTFGAEARIRDTTNSVTFAGTNGLSTAAGVGNQGYLNLMLSTVITLSGTATVALQVRRAVLANNVDVLAAAVNDATANTGSEIQTLRIA